MNDDEHFKLQQLNLKLQQLSCNGNTLRSAGERATEESLHLLQLDETSLSSTCRAAAAAEAAGRVSGMNRDGSAESSDRNNNNELFLITKPATLSLLQENLSVVKGMQWSANKANKFSALQGMDIVDGVGQNVPKNLLNDEQRSSPTETSNSRFTVNELRDALLSSTTAEVRKNTQEAHLPSRLMLGSCGKSELSLEQLPEVDDEPEENVEEAEEAQENEIYDEEDYDLYDDDARGPLVRSTSLKSATTEPITPGRKKMVRFADALGLDLTYVRTISQEDIPTVPASVFDRLQLARTTTVRLPIRPLGALNRAYFSRAFGDEEAGSSFSGSGRVSTGGGGFSPESACGTEWPVLIPEFVQPFTTCSFLQRVQQQHVCLESCMVSSLGGQLSADCIVRVSNCAFEKSVLIRHTCDNWNTWLDSLASYIPNSCDGNTDKFSVKFYIRGLARGQRAKFAIRYLAGGQEHWDNNMGSDYSLLYKL